MLNTNLCHFCQIQWRPLFVCVIWSPALHTSLLLIEDAWLWATTGKTPLSSTAFQFWSGVGGAVRWRSTRLREANLFMREVEGLRWRVGGQGHWGRGGGSQAGERRRPWRALGERRQLKGVGSGRQAETGAALHAREATLHVSNTAALDASSTVAPPLFHSCPHARALRTPGRATTTELVWARQGPALSFAGGSGGVRGLS